MAEEEKKEEVKKKDEKQPNKEGEQNKSNQMIFFGVIGGIIVVNALIAFLLVFGINKMAGKGDSEDEGKSDTTQAMRTEAVPVGGITDPPVEAVVNISGTGGNRFLKTVIVFEYDDSKYGDFAGAFEKFRPKIRDKLIDMLSIIPLKELESPDIKDEIRRDLIREVNRIVPVKTGQVRDVFFKSFIIQ